MSFLYALEGLRTPFWDAVMSLITKAGEETLVIVLALLFLWCIDKHEGYYLLTVGFFGLLANQFLKLLCRIPRPWVKDPSFTIVESAREAATGYSFPSGHTQNIVGCLGAVGRWHKKLWLRLALGGAALLVAFSRMYLGVHTPLDVFVSIVLGLFFVFVLYPLVKESEKRPRVLFYILGVLLLFAFSFVLYTEFHVFSPDVDAANLASGAKNGYRILGSLLGFLLIYVLDVYVYRYDTKAPLFAQTLKLLFGFVTVLLIKIFLKAPLLALTGGHPLADGIRYFLIFAVAGGVGPLLFPYFTRFSNFLSEKIKARRKA